MFRRAASIISIICNILMFNNSGMRGILIFYDRNLRLFLVLSTISLSIFETLKITNKIKQKDKTDRKFEFPGL
jgi:hypothetical protein